MASGFGERIVPEESSSFETHLYALSPLLSRARAQASFLLITATFQSISRGRTVVFCTWNILLKPDHFCALQTSLSSP